MSKPAGPQHSSSHPLYVAGLPGWTQPTVTGIGRLPSRAPLVPYPTIELARVGVRGTTPWMRSLNGVWDFRLLPNPDEVSWADVADESPGLADEPGSWGPINVPGAWNDVRNFAGDGGEALHPERGLPHYTNVLMPFGEEPPNVPHDNNPTGIYRTSVDLDNAWIQRRVVLQLGGTDSMHWVFVNGRPGGVGTDTRVTSEYDITDLVHVGRNIVTIVVVRWSANSWLEDQDQWWMSGITRDVSLLSLGHVSVEQVKALTGALDPLSPSPTGTLEAEVHVRFSQDPQPGWTVRCRVETPQGELVSARTRADETYPGPFLPGRIGGAQPGQVEHDQSHASQPIAPCEYAASVPVLDRATPGRTAHDGNVFPGHRVRFRAEVPNALLWSTEKPYRYRLLAELVSPDGGVAEVVSQFIGFRSVEVKNRELLLNGRPVLIKGVNRHDHDEFTAAVPSRSTMRLDIETMKRFNVNAVRMSHYPPDPYVLDLCDELGLWVIDETNFESHGRFRSLVNDPQYQTQCLERLSRMVARDVNHPSIVAWSLGNESGYGPVHDAMAAWARHFDPTRVVHYEGPHRYDLGPHGRVATDLVAPMYPSIDRIEAWAVRQAEQPDDDRPLILCEYSHAMGNSNGSLADHDTLFRSHHGLQGGFIWEWIDHGLRIGADFEGRPVWAYGGHFGDEPNDGAFVADGLVWPDRVPHPGLWEAAHVWRPVRVTLSPGGDLLITSDRDFSTLDDLQCTYEVLVNGQAVELGSIDVPAILPGATATVPLPGAHLQLDNGEEGHVTVRWSTRSATLWCEQNHVVAWDQVALPAGAARVDAQTPAVAGASAEIVDEQLVVSDGILTVTSSLSGSMQAVSVNGTNVISRPHEIRVVRARIDNDGVPEGVLGLPGVGRVWTKWGLDQASLRTVSDLGTGPQGPVVSTTHLIAPPGVNGSVIEVSERRSSLGGASLLFEYSAHVPDALGDLPRLGTVFTLDDAEQLEWFGLGPLESYADRRSAATVARWKSTVTDQYVPYINPQDHGRHEATRWVHVHNGTVGIVVTAHPGMRLFSFSARHFDDADLTEAESAGHLIPRAKTLLSIDHRVRGVGTGSCGPDTLAAYRIAAGSYSWSFAVSAWQQGQDPGTVATAISW